MREKSTYIKLDRNIVNWRWYHDANTFRVFIHLLINANIRENDFETAKISRGELATSYSSIAGALGLSVQNVRTAIRHLKETGELTAKQHRKFLVISITNYDLYQGNLTGKQQSSNIELTSNSQQLKNGKNGKNDKEIYGCRQNVYLSKSDFDSFCSEFPDWDKRIDALSMYMASTGKSYKDHYATLKIWANDSKEEKKPFNIWEDL